MRWLIPFVLLLATPASAETARGEVSATLVETATLNTNGTVTGVQPEYCENGICYY